MMTMRKAGRSAADDDPDALDYGSDDDGAPAPRATTPRTVVGRPVAAQRPSSAAPCSTSRGGGSFLDRLVDNVGLYGGSSSR